MKDKLCVQLVTPPRLGSYEYSMVGTWNGDAWIFDNVAMVGVSAKPICESLPYEVHASWLVLCFVFAFGLGKFLKE